MSTKAKVVIITGGAQRLGKVIAEALHAAGYNVIISYRNSAAKAQELCNILNQQRANSAACYPLDLNNTNFSEFAALSVAQWGQIDALINNAANFIATNFDNLSLEEWDASINTNLRGPVFLTQALLPYLNDGAAVINIADIHGSKPLKGYGVYSIAKAGLIMLTQTLAKDYGARLRVNSIAPGPILWNEDIDANLRQELITRTAIQSEPVPYDVAHTALYLLESSYITGQILYVDGGRNLNM